jgi:hypothetical protein
LRGEVCARKEGEREYGCRPGGAYAIIGAVLTADKQLSRCKANGWSRQDGSRAGGRLAPLL